VLRRLHDPAFSLEVGQRYVHYLARPSRWAAT
jgi:hypothetical protein